MRHIKKEEKEGKIINKVHDCVLFFIYKESAFNVRK